MRLDHCQLQSFGQLPDQRQFHQPETAAAAQVRQHREAEPGLGGRGARGWRQTGAGEWRVATGGQTDHAQSAVTQGE